MHLSTEPALRTLRVWYALVALGEPERLQRRGWSSRSAESGTAITLAGASLLNFACLIILLGWVPTAERPLLLASTFTLLFILERFHLAAIRGWLREADRPSSESKRRARVSSIYIWSSLAGVAIAALYHIEFR